MRSALALRPNESMARGVLQQSERQRTDTTETETPEDYLNRSLELYRAERFEEAIAACHDALKLRSNYAEAWNNICAANNKLGRYEEAAAACETALRFKPDFDLAQNNLQYARERSTSTEIRASISYFRATTRRLREPVRFQNVPANRQTGSHCA